MYIYDITAYASELLLFGQLNLDMEHYIHDDSYNDASVATARTLRWSHTRSVSDWIRIIDEDVMTAKVCLRWPLLQHALGPMSARSDWYTQLAISTEDHFHTPAYRPPIASILLVVVMATTTCDFYTKQTLIYTNTHGTISTYRFIKTFFERGVAAAAAQWRTGYVVLNGE